MKQRHRPKEVAEKLANWSNVGDRDAPVAFVGRDQEIDLTTRQIATWRPGETRGRTIIAQGAPGAGKTALLHEFGRRLPTVVPNAASVYLPTPWIDADVPDLLKALAVEMTGVPSDSLRTTQSARHTAGVKALATTQLGRSRSVSPPEVTTWSAFQRHFAGLANQSRPTLLLVDEIQRIGAGEATKNLLHHLHDQTSFPVLLVCGGLSTSVARLGELGLSRLDEAHILHVAALTPTETHQCLEESLRIMADDVGIGGHPDQWARRLAPPTHGWPQHITGHFRAAAEALLESARPVFDDENLGRALALAEINARRYYDRRLEASRTNPVIVFAVHEAAMHGEMDADDAADTVEKTVATLSGSRKARHHANFAGASDCVDQMLYAGVIAYATNATTSPLSVPIPSMATQIANLLPLARRQEVCRVLGLPTGHG